MWGKVLISLLLKLLGDIFRSWRFILEELLYSVVFSTLHVGFVISGITMMKPIDMRFRCNVGEIPVRFFIV